MLKKEGLAQIYELLFLPADDDVPEYIHLEDEEGSNALAILERYTPKGALVYKEIVMQDWDSSTED
tara:strand:+ start:1144 stop:1341 length:198 start_codon:yes stop_codon:yes gene_type:complete